MKENENCFERNGRMSTIQEWSVDYIILFIIFSWSVNIIPCDELHIEEQIKQPP